MSISDTALRREMRHIILGICILAAPLFFTATAQAVDAAEEINVEGVPVLVESGESDSVLVRWSAFGMKTHFLHYAAAKEGDTLPAKHEIIECAPQKGSGMPLYLAKMPIEPGKTYRYGISETAAEPPAELYTFRADDGRALTVLFASDAHLCNAANAENLDEALEHGMDNAPLDLVYITGDVLDKTTYAHEIIVPAASTLQTVPTAVIPGNHDSFFSLYQYFPMPNLTGSYKNYSFVKDNVLFIGLNIWGEWWSGCMDFLCRSVQEHPECDWRVVTVHYSTQSNGDHYSDRMVVGLQRLLEKTCEEMDIDLVFSGHDHEYNRSHLLCANGVSTEVGDERIEKSSGETVYITLPTVTGCKYYEERLVAPPDDILAAEGLEKGRGYMIAEFTPEEVTLTAYALDDDEIIDYSVLTRK